MRLVWLVGALVLSVWSLPANALSLSGFQNSLVELLLRRISVPGSFEVNTKSVDNDRVGDVRLTGVTVSDSQGIWFRADSIQFAWSVAALLKREAIIRRLHLVNARVERAPVVAQQPASETRSSQASSAWPRAPLPLVVGDISIRNMYVAPTILPGGIRFNATGKLRDKGSSQSLMLNVRRSDHVAGNIDVGYLKRFDNGELDLRVGMQEGAGGLAALGLGLPDDTPVTLRVNASGPPAGLSGGLRFDLKDFLSGEGQLSAAWSNRISTSLSVNLSAGRRLDPNVVKALGATPKLELSLLEDANRVVLVQRGRLDAGAIQAQASGRYNRTTGSPDLRVTLAVDPSAAGRLDELIAPLKIASGRFEFAMLGSRNDLQLSGDGQVQSPRFGEFSARASTVNFSVQQTPHGTGDSSPPWKLELDAVLQEPRSSRSRAIAQALGKRVALSARASGSDEHIQISSMEIRAEELVADIFGNIGIVPTGLVPELRYKLRSNLKTLASIANVDASGRVSGEGKVTSTDGATVVRGVLNVTKAVASGRPLGKVRLRHTARLRAVVDGTFALELIDRRVGTARAKGNYRISEQETAFSKFELNAYGVTARGELSLAKNSLFPRGDFTVSANDLSMLGRVLKVPLRGGVRGKVKSSTRQRGSATATLQIKALRLNDLTVESAVLDARVTELQKDPRVQLTGAAQTVQAGALELAKLEARANGWLSDITAELQGQGSLAGRQLTAATAVQVKRTRKDARDVHINQLTANFAGEEIMLAAPSIVTIDSDSTRTNKPFRLRLQRGGAVALDGVVTETVARGSLAASGIPLVLARLFVDAPIAAGKLEATAELNTNRAAPKLELRADVRRVLIAGVPEDVGELGATITASWRGKDLKAQAKLEGPFDQPLSAEVLLPLTLAEGPFPALPPRAPVAARINWRGDIAPVYALLPLPDHLLAGAAVVDVKARGTVEALRLSGDLRLRAGRYEHLISGTIINNLALQTRFDESGRIRFEVSGDDGGKGRFQVAGNVSEANVDAALDIEAKVLDALVVRSDAAVVRANAALAVRGTVSKQLHVNGRVDVTRAELRLVDSGIGDVADIGPVENVDDQKTRANASRSASGAATTLDITVAMPQEVFVRGRGLNSEWGGNLRIRGSTADPQIAGRIEARRGAFDLIGKTFKLVRGLVVFDGAKGVDPSLDVRLERIAGDTVGAIVLGGRASAPELGFSAIPAVPEDEVLPRILFGRSRQSLSASEALQLASTAHMFASGDASMLDQARNALGLDVLRLDSSDADAAGSLVLGRYVNDGVYVGARQSLDGSSSSVVVEVELMNNIVIEGDVNQGAESGVGVTWRKDF